MTNFNFLFLRKECEQRMKNVRKRLAAGLMSCLVVGSLGVMPVLAGTIGDNGVYVGNDTTVTIGKDLVVYNDGYSQSYSPNITYSYSIAPIASADGLSVTDSTGKQMEVKVGDADAVVNATTTVAFTSQLLQEHTADQNYLAEGLRGDITFAFDITKFDAPGIYRYVVTDTTSDETLVHAGIIRPSDYEDTKYLDVYVVEALNSTDPTKPYEIAGYVLLDENTVVTEVTDKDIGFRSSITTITEIPVPGTTVPGTPGGQDTTVEAGHTGVVGDNSFDYYYSFNVDVSKVITGNMADKVHDFPFEITVANPGDGFTVATNYFAGDNMSDLTTSTATTVTTGLSDGDHYYLCGLNPFAAITVMETNDTRSTYNVTISDGRVTNVATAPMGTQTSSAIVVSSYNSAATTAPSEINPNTNNDLIFTNDLEAGPPTGLMLVIAPFIAVAALIGGIFVLNKVKTKKNTETN